MNSHRLTLHSYVKDSCGYHWDHDSEPQWTSSLCVSETLATETFLRAQQEKLPSPGGCAPQTSIKFTTLPAPSASMYYTTAWATLITSTQTETLWIKAHIITQNKWESKACCGLLQRTKHKAEKETVIDPAWLFKWRSVISITTSALTYSWTRKQNCLSVWQHNNLRKSPTDENLVWQWPSNAVQLNSETVNLSTVTSMVKCRQLKVHSFVFMWQFRVKWDTEGLNSDTLKGKCVERCFVHKLTVVPLILP